MPITEKKVSLRDKAYSHIRERIIRGELQPGQFLSEPMIARELNVSRMPVRDAIRRLQSERLLDQIPRTGTFVRKLDFSEIKELYQVREALEISAVSTAAQWINDEELAQLGDLLGEMRSACERANGGPLSEHDALKFSTADSAFHVTIISASGNRLLGTLMASLNPLSRLAQPQALAIRNAKAVSGAVEQHARILNALTERDCAAASLAMAKHIRYSLAMIVETGGTPGGDSATHARLPSGLLERIERLESNLTTETLRNCSVENLDRTIEGSSRCA